MDVQEYLTEVEHLSHAGRMCDVCWTELRPDTVEARAVDVMFCHIAFYSVVCRTWWLCQEHLDFAVEHYSEPWDEEYCGSNDGQCNACQAIQTAKLRRGG